MQTYHPRNSQIEVEASEWLARLGNNDPGCDTAEREIELAAWLRQSPGHVRAFLDASDAFYRLDGLTALSGAEVRRSVDRNASNVTSLPGKISAPKIKKSRRIVSAAAAAVAAVAIGAIWLNWTGNRAQTYTTALGEQRTVKLDDGSFIHLNTRSRITVELSDRLRRIVLVQGEGLFTVERDPRRPFIVHTAGTTVRAVGTAFNVYRRGSDVQVAVVEGRVQVSADKKSATNSIAGPASSQPIMLNAGEEATVAKGQVAKASAAAVTDAIAWRQRRLVFRDTPLAEVAAEFNRYNKEQLRIEGDVLQAKPLTGIFSADHPQSLILYLSEFNSLKVTLEGENWRVRAP